MDEQQRKSYWLHETTIEQGDRLVMSKKLIRSKAFIKLTGAAKQMLLELYMRLTLESYKPSKRHRSQQFYAGNNGKLKITYESTHKMFGYSTTTISSGINQLVNYGFIEIAELGCGVKRLSHKIALINNWKDYGTDKFFAGKGKADEPVNGGFKKCKNLKTTSETKEGTTLETKAVQSPKQPEPP
jgi:hypothetical protein